MFYKSDKTFSISHLQKHCVHCNTTAWNNFLAFLSNCTGRPVVDKLKLEVNREEKQKNIKHLKVFHGWIYLKSSLSQFLFIFISSAFVCFNVCLILSWTPESVFWLLLWFRFLMIFNDGESLFDKNVNLPWGSQLILVWLWKYSGICSWNQPVLSNEGKVSCSR